MRKELNSYRSFEPNGGEINGFSTHDELFDDSSYGYEIMRNYINDLASDSSCDDPMGLESDHSEKP